MKTLLPLNTPFLEHVARAHAPANRSRIWQMLRYYSLLLFITLVGLLYGYLVSEVYFPGSKPPAVEAIISVLKLAWLVPLPYAAINFYAYLRYPVIPQQQPAHTHLSEDITLYIRYVTRGKNPDLIAENTRLACHILSAALPDRNWWVEVVTDNPLAADDPCGRVRVILVPSDYQTKHGAKYKARALQYALEASPARPQDWIVHLDEETRFTEDTIYAICDFIAQQRAAPGQQSPKIGQGVIVYGAGTVVNWITTLADSIRVADDYGRFNFQFQHGKAWFGLHGSFVVINNAVERLIGFDHGAASSITEDTYFALVAQQLGVGFAPVAGRMYERSPFSIGDFIRQRRRWFGGLWLCVRSDSLPLRVRLVLALFMAMWSTSWLCLAMTVFNCLYPTGTPLWLSLLAGLTFVYNVSMYAFGLRWTWEPGTHPRGFARLMALQIVLVPVFAMMEGAAVIYSLVSPPRDFFIVQKEVQRA